MINITELPLGAEESDTGVEGCGHEKGLLHQAGVTEFGATDFVSTFDASSTWSVSGLEAASCENL